jgi:DNA-binding beta-propeller fold protein YncE
VVVHESSTGRETVVGQGLTQPVSVVADRSNGTAWVGDAGSGVVAHLQPTGEPADPPALGGLQYPGSLALDARNGSLWVVEQDGNRVRRYDATGALAATADVPPPTAVAADSLTHEAWVTSFLLGRVVRLSPNGVPLDTITACRGPIGIAVDAPRRRIWVADALANQAVALARDGSVQFRITGLPEARTIVVDGSSGEAWVTLTAAGAVARLSPTGHEITRVGGLSGPWGLALDDLSARLASIAASDARNSAAAAGGAEIRRR